MSTMGPSPHHSAPQTFKSLLFSLQSDPNNLIAEYEHHRKKAHEEYTTLEDYQADTLLSTLAKEEESWTDCVKWRLIELWRSGKDEDEISTLLCDEMKDLGVLDDMKYVVMIGLKSWYEKRRRILLAKKEEEDENEEILSPSVISAAGRSIRQRTSAQISPSQSIPPPPTAPSPAPDPTPVAPLLQLQHGLGEYLQQFRFALRLPIQLFLRLFFYLAVIYFLFNCLIFLLQKIPIIGPTIVFLINRIHALILAESTAPKPPTTWLPNFNVSSNALFTNIVFPIFSIFTSSSGSNNLVEEGEGFIGANALLATMDNTQSLTQISLQLLPVAKILEFSSYSLLSAGSLVAASDLKFKVPLAEEYDHLVELTRAMETSLSSFSIAVEMIPRHFSLHLNVTLERIYKIVAESNGRRANPLWDMVTHAATLTSGACSVLPMLYSLDLGTLIACSASLFLSTQGHCYLLSKEEGTPPTHSHLLRTVCAPTRYFDPASVGVAANKQLHEEAQMLANEFSDLISAMSEQVDVLLEESQKGRAQAQSLQKSYEEVSKYRKMNEKEILYNQSTFSIKAQHTPTWPEWFTGRGHGLQDDEKYDGVRIHGQWRDLKELESLHRHADLYLKAAIDVLGNMQTDLRLLSHDVEYFEQFHVYHKSWHILTDEMKDLEPLLARLDTLNHEHDSERKKVAKQWRDRWDYCMRQRRAVQKQMMEMSVMGRGWEDCLFET
ncbi:hypothetical protein BKA61DRAFT_572573 [Leptodontidium sp. MPI-SDFR-AT-0119]|nr:hypothetical protein BKA61DRAFT_572573 [Leptodontidium sp. MPI-SDFR-AT-0119]